MVLAYELGFEQPFTKGRASEWMKQAITFSLKPKSKQNVQRSIGEKGVFTEEEIAQWYRVVELDDDKLTWAEHTAEMNLVLSPGLEEEDVEYRRLTRTSQRRWFKARRKALC